MSPTDPATGPQTPEEEVDQLRGDIAETREAALFASPAAPANRDDHQGGGRP